MSIDYKVVARGEPGVTGGGVIKYYASSTTRKKVDIEQISADISEMSTITPMDTQAVILSLIQLIPRYLKMGMQVDLAHLGSFYASIHSEGKATPEEVSSQSIRRVKPIFRAGAPFQQRLDSATFNKVE